MASRVPASGDDWAWGTELGTARLRTAFVDYNGRYVGNIIVLIMTRLGWVTPILEALGFAFVIGLILDITHNRTMLGYVTLISLVFLMPARLWSESAVWVSGYANYAVATLVMLYFCDSLRELVQCANDQQNPALLGVIFGLSVAAQLIVEHVTIYLLVASLAALLVARSNQQGVNRRLASSALGLTVGAVIMFSNSSYRLAATGDSYKRWRRRTGHSSLVCSGAAESDRYQWFGFEHCGHLHNHNADCDHGCDQAVTRRAFRERQALAGRASCSWYCWGPDCGNEDDQSALGEWLQQDGTRDGGHSWLHVVVEFASG